MSGKRKREEREREREREMYLLLSNLSIYLSIVASDFSMIFCLVTDISDKNQSFYPRKGYFTTKRGIA